MPYDEALISPSFTSCIVCDRTPLTRTHIWPDWLKSVLPRQTEHHLFAEYKDPGAPPGERRRVTQRYKRDYFARNPLLACSDCNGGWMKKFEDDVVGFMKPALAGELTKQLTKEEQHALAGWLALITILSEYADYENPTNGRAELLHLKRHRVPPNNFNIYVAEGVGTNRWTRFCRFHNFYVGIQGHPVSIAADGRPQYNGQVTTTGVVNFISHVFSGPDCAPIQSYCIAMEGFGMERIWPPKRSFWTGKQGLLDFPLKSKLSDEKTNALAEELHLRVKEYSFRHLK